MSRGVIYYRDRVLDYLDRFGFPLRNRALLFFSRPATAIVAAATYGVDGIIEPVTTERLRDLNWAEDRGIIDEVTQWKGDGKQWVVAARRNDDLDGYCWVESSVGDLRFFDLEWPFPPGMFYISRAWVLPGCRNQGIGGKLLDGAAIFAKELGATKILCSCVPENSSMRHLLTESGWTYRCRVDYLRVGPLVRCTLRPEASQPSSYHSALAAIRQLTKYLSE